MSQNTLLIVEQQLQPPENLPELLKALAGRCQLDIYQSRQRLVGRGLSLLSKGGREAQEKVSSLLLPYGFRHWLIEPTKPEYVPPRLRSLQIKTDQIILTSRDKTLSINRGDRILAVLAEMSGALAEQNVRQLLTSHAYRGRDNVRYLAHHKVYKTILQGDPLLDLYRLDADGRVNGAVRVFPGKFDHHGLGELSTSSSRQNLDRLLKLVEEYAGNFSLQTDFGLVNLPGCILQRGCRNNPDILRQNQLSLARYGWLLTDLLRTGSVSAESSGPGSATSTVAAPVFPEVISSLSQELDPATEAAKPTADSGLPDPRDERPVATAESTLPPPPEQVRGRRWCRLDLWFGSAAGLFLAGLMALGEADPRSLKHLFHAAFDHGGLQLGLAGLLFWGAFAFIRLKRQIENTPTSRVRSIAMGLVEVKGRALRRYAVISPMTHTPCVYYRLSRYRRNRNRQWSLSSVSSSDAIPFYLEDDTGRVAIEPAGCRLSAGSKNQGSAGMGGFLQQNDDSEERWVEEVIVEGTRLYILGYAGLKTSEDATLNDRRIRALRELKGDRQRLASFDRNADGRVDEGEWDSARHEVEQQLLQQSLEQHQQQKKQQDQVLIRKKAGRPFIIAETHSEQQLTNRYALYSIPMLIGGLIFCGWGLFALLNH